MSNDPAAIVSNLHPLRIFLCHSSADKPAVRELYKRLWADGFEPWLDEEDLLPGQDWQRQIPIAVRESDVVIVCLSCGSVNKAGYIQKEIKFALDVADEQPEGAIFIIPVKLEDCKVPDRLSRWHWVNYFAANGYDRLLRALYERAKSLGISAIPAHATGSSQGPRKARRKTPPEPEVLRTAEEGSAKTKVKKWLSGSYRGLLRFWTNLPPHIISLGGLGLLVIVLLALIFAVNGGIFSATPTPVFTITPTPTFTPTPTDTLTPTSTSTTTPTSPATPTRVPPRLTLTPTPITSPLCRPGYFWNPVMNRCQQS